MRRTAFRQMLLTRHGRSAVLLIGTLDREIPAEAYLDDIHSRPDWRRHVTGICAEEIRRELAA